MIKEVRLRFLLVAFLSPSTREINSFTMPLSFFELSFPIPLQIGLSLSMTFPASSNNSYNVLCGNKFSSLQICLELCFARCSVHFHKFQPFLMVSIANLMEMMDRQRSIDPPLIPHLKPAALSRSLYKFK